ncbi:tetratricopeptide repeat-containing S1 family peptidase [Spirulina major]|uniref:tetratricopeptide repeat-containing S1 family peptidase n=1 Tax=Spirulina major TaxID=270636 RepID=UPI0009351722|nr:tetratricopeptide repeat-containing serine protease family protein [Spirulina major]
MVWQSARTGLGGLMVLGLVGCATLPDWIPERRKPLERDVLVAQIKPSVVRITYGDQRGQGTGFIIAGEAGLCTVATAGHVVKPSELISVWTHDVDTVNPGGFPARAVQSSGNGMDLAIITFDAPGEGCPYPALTLGDSGTIQTLDEVYVFGFPEGGERALYQQQVATGEISAVDGGNAEGYDITYGSQTAAGMSGGPLVNVWGEVVAVHGREEAGFRLAVPIAKLQGELAAMLAQLPVVAEGTAKAFYEQGIERFNDGGYLEALEFFAKAIETEPNYLEAWYSSGLALFQLKKYDEANTAYTEALKISNTNPAIWDSRGAALLKLREYQEALNAYNTAITIDSKYANSWYERGRILRRLGDYSEAINSQESTININPDNHNAWYEKGLNFESLGDYEEALKAYENAIAINPNHSESWLSKGFTLSKLEQNNNEVIYAYQKALQINPKISTVLQYRLIDLEDTLMKVHLLVSDLESRQDRNYSDSEIREIESLYASTEKSFLLLLENLEVLNNQSENMLTLMSDSDVVNFRSDLEVTNRLLQEFEVEFYILSSRKDDLRTN